MKKIPQKKLNKLQKFTDQLGMLEYEHQRKVTKLAHQYDIHSDHFNYNYGQWTENDKIFDYELAVLHAENDRKQRIVNAQWAANFLIATNIARRGKLLHPDVAKRKLQKYGDEGKRIIQMLDTPILRFVLNSKAYLHYELYHCYNVVLMDTHTYNYVQEQLKYYGASRDRNDRWFKNWQRYNNLSKKFHKSVINQEYQK